jgi:50S ribosomal protein L16 3-hydroxylase
VLVQGVETHLRAAAELLARFRFIPDARLDDLMVSYASDGGGVGPHVDSYDVFLIQAQGRRRWRIGRQRDPKEVPGLPLKILADFRPTAEWVLEPGDLLYLPPQVAHEGTAVGSDCMTCSVGFRAPRLGEIAERWFDALAAAPIMAAQRRDPELRPTRRPGELPPALLAAEWERLRRLRPRRADAELALLTVLSEPKPSVAFTARRLPSAAARAHGVALDPRSRLLYSGDRIGINGETCRVPAGARGAIQALADRRRLTPAEYATLDTATHALLDQWLIQGWLRPD